MRKSQRTSRENPCRFCGRHDRGCIEFSDGQGAVCYKIPSDRPLSTGGFYHFLTDPTPRQPVPEPSSILADIEHRDRVYRLLFQKLGLSKAHREHLAQVRRIPADWVVKCRLRSWPVNLSERSRLAEELSRELGGPGALEGVPGLGRTLLGPSGLAIPILDLNRRIEAVRIRRDEAPDGSRYCWLSSRKKGGASPPMVPFWASPDGRPRAETLRLTEGEFKAIASARMGTFAISVPGVSAWRSAVPMLQHLKPKQILLAFDADANTKPDVARALLRCYRALTELGFTTCLEVWDSKFKGLDDALLGQSCQEVA